MKKHCVPLLFIFSLYCSPMHLWSITVRKLSKIGATRCHTLRKNAQNSISAVPLGELTKLPAVFVGLLIRGRGKKGWGKWQEMGGNGRKSEGMGKDSTVPPLLQSYFDLQVSTDSTLRSSSHEALHCGFVGRISEKHTLSVGPLH